MHGITIPVVDEKADRTFTNDDWQSKGAHQGESFAVDSNP